MCTNSISINNITIKDMFLFPRMDILIKYFRGERYFTNIYLRSGYHRIKIGEGDEWNTTFKIKEGLYEWIVMPFELTNALGTFIRMMNEILNPFQGKFVIVYLDDIMIFSKMEVDHLVHLRQVLQNSSQEKVPVNLQKCSFMQEELVYLGFIIVNVFSKYDDA